eukprot:TRINITY_DN7569_c1_g1_i1.p1 TRINITY_DN7569_c1_g1~~TRINITY_DN7569_c1_g1_i1.p1  ORF type:complete len:221 (-),score=42.71 TRINITY_DN7569_c1_g1_i1:150-749(-)
MATETKADIPKSETDTNGDKPKMERTGTMQATAEEGKEFLGDQKLEKTRGATATLQDAIKQSENESEDNNTDKPSLARATTIQATTEEAKEILGDEQRERTRKQTRDERESASSQDNDKASLQRSSTMVQTAQEGAAILGDENFGKTRSQTQKAQTPTKAVKRTSQAATDGEETSKRSKTDSSSDEQTSEKTPVVSSES